MLAPYKPEERVVRLCKLGILLFFRGTTRCDSPRKG